MAENGERDHAIKNNVHVILLHQQGLPPLSMLHFAYARMCSNRSRIMAIKAEFTIFLLFFWVTLAYALKDGERYPIFSDCEFL